MKMELWKKPYCAARMGGYFKDKSPKNIMEVWNIARIDEKHLEHNEHRSNIHDIVNASSAHQYGRVAHSLLFIQNSGRLAVEKRDGEAVIAVK